MSTIEPGPCCEMLSEQVCTAGKHATWLVNSEHHHSCPWCRIDAARMVLAEWDQPDGVGTLIDTALAALDGAEQ